MGRRKPDTDHPTRPCRRRTRDPRVVTYRYKEKMVYVTAADTHEQAVQFAREVFPDDLRHVRCRRQLSFTIISNTPDGKRAVQISPVAWNAVVSTLACYEIIDINVHPEVMLEDELEWEGDYKDVALVEELQKSSSPSVHPNDALPEYRTPSFVRRSLSPAAMGQAKGRLERVKAWMEKVKA